MKDITKKQFILTIEVDNKYIAEKYPNYRINYNKSEELIKAIIKDITFIAGVNMSKEGLKKWGYSIKIKEKKL